MSRKIHPIRKKKYPKEDRFGTWSRENANIHKIKKKVKSDDNVRPFALDASDYQLEKSETGKKSPISSMRHTRKKINDQKLKYKNDTMTQITKLQNEVETLKSSKTEISGKINDLNHKIDNIIVEYNKNCSEEEKMDDGKGLFECCLVM